MITNENELSLDACLDRIIKKEFGDSFSDVERSEFYDGKYVCQLNITLYIMGSFHSVHFLLAIDSPSNFFNFTSVGAIFAL